MNRFQGWLCNPAFPTCTTFLNTWGEDPGFPETHSKEGMRGHQRHLASQRPHPHASGGSCRLPREPGLRGAPSNTDPSPKGAQSTHPGPAHSEGQEVCSEARDGRGHFTSSHRGVQKHDPHPLPCPSSLLCSVLQLPFWLSFAAAPHFLGS